MRLLFLISSLFISLSAIAQSTVSGRVQDQNGQALGFVNVLLMTPTDSAMVKGAVADTTGAYVLDDVTPGTYLVSAQMVGYQAYFSAPFTTDGTPYAQPAIQIQEATTELGEVVVKAAKPLIEVTPNALTVNVASSPILSNGTAQDVLKKSPGVVVDQDGKISLKGKGNVLVYLDGKQTYLSESDLIRLLESTPAADIEKIEIMDNPPARYDAEGNAGIINIVRTKEAAIGLNGNISLNLGKGIYYKTNPSIGLNYRQKKFNVFGNYSYYDGQWFNGNTITRRIPVRDTITGNQVGTTIFNLRSDRVGRSRNNNFRTGADWFITPQTTFGILVSGSLGSWNGNADNATVIEGDNPLNPYDSIQANADNLNEWQNITYNANFKQAWEDGATLTLDADWGRWKNTGGQENDNFFFDEEQTIEPPLLVRINTKTNIDILALKADYSRTLAGDWGLEFGGKQSVVKTNNIFNYGEIQSGENVLDPDRSNQFQYDELISAGYVDLKKKLSEHWQIQAGVRGERTYSKGVSVTLDSTVQRDYFNLFPSASVGYTLPGKHSVSASYSRRIDRPDYGDLNPFEYFLDRFTFSRGNPFLNPQYTNAFGLTYGLKDAVFLTLNYNRTTDAMTEVLLQDDSTQTTFVTEVNLSRIEVYSANLTAPLPIKKWWMMNLNATVSYNDILSPFSEGGQIDNSQLSFNGRLQNTFTLPSDVKLEVMGFYNSPQLWGVFEVSQMYWLELGLSKDWGRFQAQASIDDVFNTQGNTVNIQQGDIDTFVRNKWESRVYRFKLSYRFGNENIKQARQRGTASDDVQQRAGSGNN